jgi:indolepyruvate ferredoxin oxidoreductase beta subunit
VNGVSTVALAGVGGQGIILAAAIVAQAAMASGFEVKTSEVHGMAQRGGSVVSTVRYGKEVWSPVAPRADLVIATETLEGRRALGLLSDKGTLVYATTVIAPGSVLRGERAYPDDLAEAAQARLVRLIAVDADALGREAGSVRAANVALVGAATHALPFASRAWERALELAVPAKMLELNRRAFALGREAATATVAATEEGS